MPKFQQIIAEAAPKGEMTPKAKAAEAPAAKSKKASAAKEASVALAQIARGVKDQALEAIAQRLAWRARQLSRDVA